MGLDFKVGAVAVLLVFLCLSIAAGATSDDSYMRAYVPDYIRPGSTIFVTGEAFQAGSAASLNVTVRITSSTNSSVYLNYTNTNSTTGAFNISLALPNSAGQFTVSVTSNSSTLPEKNFTVNTSHFQGASLEFLGNQPPFAPGDSITIKTTAKYQNGTALGAGYNIVMGIYSGNGKVVSWGTERANATISDGTTTHNFNISSSADPGDYIADMYGKHVVFTIKKYSVSGLTLDNSSESSAFFSPGSVVDVCTKVKNATDDPQTGASVYATIVYPNGTESNPIALTNTSLGIYDYNFTLPSATGTYTVRINSTIGSVAEETQSTFTVQDVRLSLEKSSFGDVFGQGFDMWGGDEVIYPGSNASFDIKVFDLSTGKSLPVITSAGSKGMWGCNSTEVQILDVTNMDTGANVTASVTGNQTTTATSLKFMGGSMCTVTLRTPQTAGKYRIILNATVNYSVSPARYTATGYFNTQNYKLKVMPITTMGRDKSHALLRPGRNATFKFEVRNITAKSTLASPNIDAVQVTALTSMGEFTFGGATDTTSVSYWYSNSTNKLTVFIPENMTGPTLVKVQATIITGSSQGETMTGDGFFFAKYVMGFVGPMFGGMMGGPGGDGGEMEEGQMGGSGGGPTGMGGTAMSCSGVMEFQGFTMDVETEQPQESVVVKKGMIREELTGRDVSSCFTVQGGGAKSDSNGRVSINLTFSVGTGCPYSAATQLSGSYFSIWDAKWQNYTDSLPGSFECKNFNFWPYMTNWDVGPNSSINFTVSNIVYMSNMSKYVRNGTITLSRLINFEPSRGPTVLDVSGAPSVTITNETSYYAFWPANFSALTANNNGEWYSGFYDAMIRVCDSNNTASTADDTCDTSFGGFAVFPFKAYIMSQDVWNTTGYMWMPGDTKVLEIWSENLIGQNVTIKRMDFMTGEQVDITLIQNRTASIPAQGGGFNITVNFTLPRTLEKGDGMITIELTDNQSNKVTTDIFAQIKTFTVICPQAVFPGEDNIQQPQKKLNLYGLSYEQTNKTIMLNSTGMSESDVGNLINNLNLGAVYTVASANATIINMRAWDLNSIWLNHSLQSSRANNPDVRGYGGYCVFENTFNKSEHIIVIDNGTPNTPTPGSYTHIFVKYNGTNGTDNITGPGYSLRGPFVPGDHIGNGIYLSHFEYCFPFLISSSKADYTTLVGQNNLNQYWSTQWGWAGRHRVNENFTIPFLVQWVNGSADAGANVTITQIAGANFDKKGFTAALTAGQFRVYDNRTDSRGLSMVKLNISASGMYRPFWWVNSSSGIEESAGFDNAMVMQVSAFECYGQWESNTGSGMEGVMVNTTSNVTGVIRAAYFNQSSVANANISLYYMDFSSDFGPPTQTNLAVASDLYYPNNGSIMPATDTPKTNSNGVFNVTIKPSGGWPTSRYGACVELQGTATAALEIANTTYQERFFMGRVCTYPTG